MKQSKPLFTSSDWAIGDIDRVWEVIDKIGKEVFKLDYYAPQIEIISSEQMLEAYSTVAMPVYYDHWSLGKEFIANKQSYKQGQQGLAYEVVINTNPTLAYLMENNTMTMQTLVMAHAICGHGSFFKNNYLFKDWTDADAILDYLVFARDYIYKAEEQHGVQQVEQWLDACHSVHRYGIDKYKKPEPLSEDELFLRSQDTRTNRETLYNDLWATTVKKSSRKRSNKTTYREENILYFIEKNAPRLKPWQKEILRITRKIAQYFYPQQQTQVMNEGWATFIHYTIMSYMHDEGLITEGSYLEFLDNHTAVVNQPDSLNINPYALGFAMMQDIKRICENPTEEDLKYFKSIANTDWIETMKDIVANYRDESFIQQFLSPKVARDFKMFGLHNDTRNKENYVITSTANHLDFEKLRDDLASQYRLVDYTPHIEVTKVDWKTDRCLHLEHVAHNGVALKKDTKEKTLKYLKHLWGFPVVLEETGLPCKREELVELLGAALVEARKVFTALRVHNCLNSNTDQFITVTEHLLYVCANPKYSLTEYLEGAQHTYLFNSDRLTDLTDEISRLFEWKKLYTMIKDILKGVEDLVGDQ